MPTRKLRMIVAFATSLTLLLGTVGIGLAARPLVLLLPGEPALLVGQLGEEGSEETSPWQVEVRESDLSGFAGIIEFDLPRGGVFLGRLSGSVEWGTINGVLTSDEGRTFGTFSGEISLDSAGGQYLLADGRQGAWTFPLE